jgi:hypothetical protein
MTPQTISYDPMVRAAGGLAIMCGIVSGIGVVLLIGMFVLFGASNLPLGLTFGGLNDIFVALQYLLSIPLALALYRILGPYSPALMRTATIIGIAMMLVVVGLLQLLIFRAMSFEEQVSWVLLAMIVGVGSWLVITGLVARSTGRFPMSVLMSAVAVPYFGYPIWAFWLGRHLLRL